MRIIRITIALLAASILLPMKTYSQEVPLSLEDLIPGGKTFYKYRAEMPRQFGWQGDKLLQIKGDSLIVIDFANKGNNTNTEVFATLAEVNAALGDNASSTRASIGNLNYLASIDPASDEAFIRIGNDIFTYNFAEKKVTGILADAKIKKNTDYNFSSKTFAYTRENNLYIEKSGSEAVAITNEADTNIVYGQSVHQREFGINKGTFWSPKGNLLAFYRMDESMVGSYPLADISARQAALKNLKYPMAGMKSHHVTLGVYNPDSQKTIYLKTGTPKEKYLTNIAWSPDEKYIYIAELNRGQDTCVLKSYDAVSGKLHATLFTETHAKYVEPENPVLFLKNNPNQFIWFSRRDGYNHAYLYNTDGKLVKQLTKGNWEIASVLGFDEKGENLLYLSTEASPIEKHVYKVSLKNGKKEHLSKEEGVHYATLSASGKYIMDFYTSQFNAGKVALTDVKTNKTIVKNEAKNPYAKIQLPEITLGTLKANDGKTDLYYRLVKPLNFDPGKKYPVIVYVYGGPHSQMVDNSWMGQARGWDIYMAERGHVVFTIDNRGTSNRGADFENITHRHLGEIETQDQMTGVEFLKSQPYVDADRIGVHGWSYGGFMTLNLMLRHPETFKVGVAGGSVTDWKYYEIMYGERYMDSPQENPEGYKNSSMVERAKDLQGRILLIHGDEDPVVVMQHSMQFIKSAIGSGTHPDFFVYPGHGHNMIGRDRVHLHEHITRYFDDFLK